MNTHELAEELQTDERHVRKFLRDLTPTDKQPGRGNRWELPNGKRELNRLRKQYEVWAAAGRNTRAPARAPARAQTQA